MKLDACLEHLLSQSNIPSSKQLHNALKNMQTEPSLAMLDAPNNMDPYNRMLLSKTDNIAILLVCWAPGMSSAPHDHGESYCSMKVLKGCLSNVFWQVNNNELSHLKPSIYNAGDILSIKKKQIHVITNLSDDPSYSLHLYVRPIQRMKVYNIDKNYYYTVPDGHGAWLPRDKNLMIDKFKIHD